MVYTGDLKSPEATHAGSSPARGTTKNTPTGVFFVWLQQPTLGA